MSEKFDWRSTLKEVVQEKSRQLGPHPSHDELVAYQAGELGEEEAKALQDHLVLCPQCARLLLDLDAFAIAAADPRSNPANPQQGAAGWRRWQVPAAAVAAILLPILAWPPGELPSYSAKLDGFVRTERSAAANLDEGTLIFESGNRLAFTIRPETTLDVLPTARAYLRHDKEFRALSGSTLEVRSGGVVSLEGIVGTDLLLPIGESELVVSVARSGALPSRDRLRKELAAKDSPRSNRWIAARRKIQVSESGSGGLSSKPDDPWVEYSGCRTVVIGPICILDGDQRLTLWVKHHPKADIRLHVGGSTGWRRSYNHTPIGGGTRYEIKVGWTKEVVVEVLQEDKRLIWALEVMRVPQPGWLAAAVKFQDHEDLAEARRLLEDRAFTSNPAEAGHALYLLAQIEGTQTELGQQLLRQAISAHRKAGHLFDAIYSANPVHHFLIEKRRIREVRQSLESFPIASAGTFANARHYLAYYRSLLAEEIGDLRTAMRWMDQAIRSAERGGANLTQEWLYAVDILARQLRTAGREEGLAALNAQKEPFMTSMCGDQAEESVLDACDCARFAGSRAWVGLLALEAGDSVDVQELSILLEESERGLEENESICGMLEDLPNVRLNRALAALHADRPEQARLHLERAKIDPEEFPRLALWQIDVQARIQLANEQPDLALRDYENLRKRAEDSFAPEAAWRAAVGRAVALEQLGQDGKAIQACNEAEQLLEEESLLVPMHAGREYFIAQRERASQFCLDLLLRANRIEEALNAVRRSSARLLSNLRADATLADLTEEERRQQDENLDTFADLRGEIEKLAAQLWETVPADQEAQLEEEIKVRRQALRGLLDQVASRAGSRGLAGRDLLQPVQGRLILAYHPLPEGWAAIASDEDGVQFERIQELPPQGDAAILSSRLLGPFAERIAQANEVRVIAYGPLRDFDFHALPIGEGILLEKVPVVYQLDLPAPSTQDPPALQALVVSGPGLREAPLEAQAVRRILEEPRFGLRRVELLEDPTAIEMLHRLDDTDLLHYAGHASYDGESRGWSSNLALSGGTQLTVDDILASSRVPRWVVLSGCETSRDLPAAPLPSIGLAQAFLVAGSQAVVAATAEVSDADAAALMESFYRHWNSPTAMAAALQQAQLELREKAPDSDWSKFRILARSLP